MPYFENQVKELKFKVLKSIAKASFEHSDLQTLLLETPKEIIPGPKATMRCCIYKERAIVQERISMGLGGHANNTNILEVIPAACDECPLGGWEVSNHCRGCVARNCAKACKRNAIGFDEANRRAFINKSLCVNCGMCAKACNYSAIINFSRPCEAACPVKAISKGENGEAVVNDNKCIGCGQCVYKCPFGAIVDKSYIKDAIDLITNDKYHTYAIIAPAIMASFRNCNIKQMVTAIKKLGFYDVLETALGADMVARKETMELLEKGKLTSSCCPSLVSFIKKEMPQYKQYISSSLSPMATLAEYIKKKDDLAKVVFIGPCTSKKYEIRTKHVGGRVDVAITFEELEAMLAAKDIDVSNQEETEFTLASSFARGFATSGGVTEAIKNELDRLGTDFTFKPVVVCGIKNFKAELTKFFSSDEYNFFEGMTCDGGCVNGPCALYHDGLNKNYLNKYKNTK